MPYSVETYNKYHRDREDERLGLFLVLNKEFAIKKVLYPGCFVHITPSFVFPYVVYVDNYKNTNTFYKNPQVLKMVEKRKKYSAKPKIVFYQKSYERKINELEGSFDLLLSQYAGFISQACKKYLKKGGLLVANNSHGDASMASLDSDFEFIGVYNRRSDTKYSISTKNLDTYFIPKKQGTKITKKYLQSLGRGIGYTKSPSGYIFRKK